MDLNKYNMKQDPCDEICKEDDMYIYRMDTYFNKNENALITTETNWKKGQMTTIESIIDKQLEEQTMTTQPSWWVSEMGRTIDGSAENSHVAFFPTIPDGTTAPGMIKSAEMKEFDGNQFFQVTYKLMDGEFKGREVRQKLKCFDFDDKRRDRAKNMLMRLFKLSNLKLAHKNIPTDKDLLPLQGKILGIKIQEWFDDNKEGNYVSEVYVVDADFIIETGKKAEHTFTTGTVTHQNIANDLDSALSRHNERGSELGAPLKDDSLADLLI
jgi:hypothetical protein